MDKMDKIVNIHYVDKEAFMNVAIVDKYEEVLTFLDSPTYEEVAYKEAVASLVDKSLEVFVSTVVNAPLHVDLNQPIVDDLSPYNGVAPIVEHKVEVQVNEYPQYEFGGSVPIKDDGHESDEEYERQHNIVGDVEAQVRHDDMDPDIVYQRACVDESDDEGPVNELDEDGLTEKEAEWYGGVSTQQGENGVGAEKDAASEEQRLMERAVKKLREVDAAEAKKMERERQYEEFEARRKEDLKMFLDQCAYEKKMKDKHKKAVEQHHNEWAAKFKIAMAEGAAKREREEELFM
ncbi:hypothetical protein D1007_00561 [Hordeum vulgare]|nr:hypothetical protein D1007_00561 [Hordeum vulgare]